MPIVQILFNLIGATTSISPAAQFLFVTPFDRTQKASILLPCCTVDAGDPGAIRPWASRPLGIMPMLIFESIAAIFGSITHIHFTALIPCTL